MTFRLGLTGSIGMGKSTTAAMFAQQGCAIWDADAAVARLYGENGAAVAPVRELGVGLIKDGLVDRAALRAAIQADSTLLNRLEAIVHPLVQADREAFFAASKASIVVFDIPLLFETGADADMDAVVCVSVSAEIQQQRVLARGTMTAEDLNVILARQMPNEEKCTRSDFVVETETMATAERQVLEIVSEINGRLAHA